MSNSLRDQLLKAGFRPTPKSKPPAPGGKRANKRRKAKPPPQSPSGEISLSRAYAERDRQEQRLEAQRKREKQREDAIRRRQNEELEALLKDRTLNDPEAEIPRHFQDGGRITRIYVTEAQREELAQRTLGIVKLRRRYLLVTADTLAEAVGIKPDCAVNLANETESD